MPANTREAKAQVAALRQLSVLHDQRQRRLAGNDSGISWFQWLMLSIGAFCVVWFCWLAGVGHTGTHLVLTSTVAIVIGFNGAFANAT